VQEAGDEIKLGPFDRQLIYTNGNKKVEERKSGIAATMLRAMRAVREDEDKRSFTRPIMPPPEMNIVQFPLAEVLREPNIQRTPELQVMLDRIAKDPWSHLFPKIRICQDSMDELASSLRSVFVPLCREYQSGEESSDLVQLWQCSLMDVACLARDIVVRFASLASLARKDTRCAAYVAAAILAFKFAEETDPTIGGFQTILETATLTAASEDERNCFYFRRQPIQSVIKMEQRIMAVLEWDLLQFVSPLSLAAAILDSLGLLPEKQMKACALAFVEQHMLYLAGTMRTEDSYMPTWVLASVALAHALSQMGGIAPQAATALIMRVLTL